MAVWVCRSGEVNAVTLCPSRGCGGTGRRAGFRSRWGEGPLEVRFLSPASLDLADESVVGELNALVDRQLGGPVRQQQPLGAGARMCVERLLERKVPARIAVELAARERGLAEEQIRAACGADE